MELSKVHVWLLWLRADNLSSGQQRFWSHFLLLLDSLYLLYFFHLLSSFVRGAAGPCGLACLTLAEAKTLKRLRWISNWEMLIVMQKPWPYNRCATWRMQGWNWRRSWGMAHLALFAGLFLIARRWQWSSFPKTAQPQKKCTSLSLLGAEEHPHLLKIQDCFACGGRLALVTELICGSDLETALTALWNSTDYSEDGYMDQLRFFSSRICLAMAFLHRRNIGHFDLKI